MARPKGIPCHPNTIAGARRHNTGRAKNETGKVLTRREIGIRYRKSHPEKYTADARRSKRRKNDEEYRKTPAYSRAVKKYRGSDKYKDRDLRFKYGISLEDKKRMLKEQKGLCGICHKPLPKAFGKCFVEHNHKTGKVRSLAHRRCNLVLGFIENTPELIAQCEAYLVKHDGKRQKTSGNPPTPR